jgi:hypothetical protein
MDLVERREIEIDGNAREISCMSLDPEGHAVAFGMIATVAVFAIENGKLAAEPSFSLMEQAPAMCYMSGIVPDYDDPNDGDDIISFYTVAIEGAYVAFHINTTLHVWNWQTKQPVRTLQYAQYPTLLAFANGMLHVGIEHDGYKTIRVTVDVTTGEQRKTNSLLSTDPADERVYAIHMPKMQHGRLVRSARTFNNMRCTIEYDTCDKGLYLCTYDLQTMDRLQLPYKIMTSVGGGYFDFQWMAVGSYIYFYYISENEWAPHTFLYVFQRKPWNKLAATTFMWCLQRHGMPIELSSCVVSSFLLAMK